MAHHLPLRQLRSLTAAGYVLLGTAMTGCLLLLAFEAPLTYDEAFNRFHYAELGLAKTLVTYDYPNNHVPFTALVVALPKSLVDWNPWSIRLVSVLFAAAMIAIVLGAARWRRTTPIVPLLLIGGSPTLVAYSFLARGYTFSAFWLALGALVTSIYARKETYARLWGIAVAGGLLAVGTWPMLTSVFAIPGWIVMVALLGGIPAALVGTTAYVVSIGLMVAPILAGVRAAANGPWNADERFWGWVHGAYSVTNLVAPCFVAALLLTAALAGAYRPRAIQRSLRELHGAARLGGVTGAMALSWYVVTGSVAGVGIIKLPYARNSVPALWLLVVTLIAAFPRHRLRWLVVALLVPGFVWSALAWSRAAGDQHWAGLPDLADLNVLSGGTPATVRSLPGRTGATSISCTWYSEMGCDLAAPRLESRGLTVVPLGPPLPRLSHCLVGTELPPRIWQVTVLRGQEPIGVACY